MPKPTTHDQTKQTQPVHVLILLLLNHQQTRCSTCCYWQADNNQHSHWGTCTSYPKDDFHSPGRRTPSNHSCRRWYPVNLAEHAP